MNLENYHIELDVESLWRNDRRGIEKDGMHHKAGPWGWVLEVMVRTLPLAPSAEKAAG